MDIPVSPKCSAHRLATALVPRLDGLKLEQISIDKGPNVISLTLIMVTHKAECPLCRRLATRVHSRYMRILADLPWSSFTIRIRLHVRRFFCTDSECRRRIFTERLPDLVLPHARRTIRHGELLRLIGLALGGRAGSRLLRRLQIQVSPNTVLGLVRRAPEAARPTPRVLGVDDFALRKGTTYGTILVDLEQHQPVDILPSRNADVLARWLKEHPGSQIITRDRSAEYARGITQGAPTAIQVADRFHLLCNLRDALERVLDSNRSKLIGIDLPREARAAPQQVGSSESLQPLPSPASPASPASTALHEPEQMTATEAVARNESQQRRRHRYRQVHELHSQGMDIKAIGKQLKLSHMTVYRYLRLDTDPVPVQRRPRPSMVDPFVPYLRQRWEGGCRNGGQLWRELQALGYPGSRKMLTVWVGQQRKKEGSSSPYTPKKYLTQVEHFEPEAQAKPASCPCVPPTSRRLAWFLMRDPESLSTTEQVVMAQLKEKGGEVISAYKLVHDFRRIMKGRLAGELDGWLQAAKESRIATMQNFALGIEKDKAAVVGALVHEWSQGQVEGQVNRLKLRKRQLYGRANFDLLRHYVLNQV
ncbi:MAG: ISL3 family transposase [Chloroflexota bacterium]|nr:ISL3 family transposase [Chloroflexota bacterium]